jgi:hypothetical protein
MKNKTFALVLAILLTVSTGLWAQGTVTTTNQDADGPNGHINRGCSLCHTPHTDLAIAQPAATGLTAAKLGTAYVSGTVPAGGIQGSGVGLPIAGNYYLWGQALPPLTYTTWDGSTINTANITSGIKSPVLHTLMCLSCHDGATSDGTHDMGGTLGGPGGTPGGAASGAFTKPNLTGTAYSTWTGAATNNGWTTASTLANSHPVHAVYATVAGGTPNAYWNVTINTTTDTVSFTDSAFVLYGTAVGHPAKLYTDGVSAYVECTTCHEPHRETNYAYQTNGWSGSWNLGGANSTIDYIRGPYTSNTNGAMNAGFCRSCHYDKTINYYTNNGANSN